jgi:hypothetical protein
VQVGRVHLGVCEYSASSGVSSTFCSLQKCATTSTYFALSPVSCNAATSFLPVQTTWVTVYRLARFPKVSIGWQTATLSYGSTPDGNPSLGNGRFSIPHRVLINSSRIHQMTFRTHSDSTPFQTTQTNCISLMSEGLVQEVLAQPQSDKLDDTVGT